MRLFFVWMAVAVLAGCSAITSTDPDRLGGGGGGRDAGGGRTDSGGGDPDGGPGPGVDSGPDEPDAGPPRCEPACDDGVGCTLDQCVEGTCRYSPDSAMCGDGMLCDPTAGCVERHCENDGECDDVQACNGVERCDPGAPGNGCVDGDPPNCNDGVSCTTDACVDPGGCVHTVDPGACGGTFCAPRVCMTEGPMRGCQPAPPPDCNDGNPCTDNSCDAALAMCLSTPRDADGDGHPAALVAGITCETGDDCNDGNAMIHPGAVEICGNGVDEDCAGGDEICTGRRGETCGSAIPVAFTGGTAVFTDTGDTTPFMDDYAFRCSSSTSRDVVYRLDVPMARDVVIDTAGSAFDTVLSVFTQCDATTDRDFLVCDDDLRNNAGGAAADLDSRVFLRNVPAGTTLYIVIDGYNSDDDGAYRLNVATFPPVASACSAAGGSTGMDISPGGTVWGVIGTHNDQAGSCGGRFDNEEVLVFTTAGPVDGHDSELVGRLGGTGFTMYVRRGDDCGSLTQEACVSTGGVGPMTAALPNIVNATHWAFIDGDAGNRYTVDYNPPR